MSIDRRRGFVGQSIEGHHPALDSLVMIPYADVNDACNVERFI